MASSSFAVQNSMIDARHALDDGATLQAGSRHGEPGASPSNATQAGSAPALGDALGQCVG